MRLFAIYKLTNGNDIVPMYAYTKKYKTLTKFLELRNPDLFKYKEIEIDDGKYPDFKEKYGRFEIKKYPILTRDPVADNILNIEYLCTEEEYMKINTTLMVILDETIFKLIKRIPYYLLKDNYKKALDTFLFSYYSDIYYADSTVDKMFNKDKLDIKYDELGILFLILKDEFKLN